MLVLQIQSILFVSFVEAGIPLHVLGGAHDTNGLDAKKVIREATEWALKF
jgi:hypothetical protein